MLAFHFSEASSIVSLLLNLKHSTKRMLEVGQACETHLKSERWPGHFPPIAPSIQHLCTEPELGVRRWGSRHWMYRKDKGKLSSWLHSSQGKVDSRQQILCINKWRCLNTSLKTSLNKTFKNISNYNSKFYCRIKFIWRFPSRKPTSELRVVKTFSPALMRSVGSLHEDTWSLYSIQSIPSKLGASNPYTKQSTCVWATQIDQVLSLD